VSFLVVISYRLLAVEEYGSSGILVPGIDLYRFCSPATVLSKTVLVLSETVLVLSETVLVIESSL